MALESKDMGWLVLSDCRVILAFNGCDLIAKDLDWFLSSLACLSFLSWENEATDCLASLLLLAALTSSGSLILTNTCLWILLIFYLIKVLLIIWFCSITASGSADSTTILRISLISSLAKVVYSEMICDSVFLRASDATFLDSSPSELSSLSSSMMAAWVFFGSSFLYFFACENALSLATDLER